jgi:hypothetical protein
MKFKSIAFGLPSLAFACTVGAVPVPSYDSTALLSEASAALVGKIVSSEVLPDGRVLLGLRVEKPFKGRLAAQQSLAVTLPVDGVQLASPSVGTRGLFVLRCAGTQCSPLDAYRAYWPAVEAGSLPRGNQDERGASIKVRRPGRAGGWRA